MLALWRFCNNNHETKVASLSRPARIAVRILSAPSWSFTFMRLIQTLLVSVLLALPGATALAQEAPDAPSQSAEDPIVRLPAQGEVRDALGRQDQGEERLAGARRLLPGGGLLVSFDTDGDGRITGEEIDLGIPAAFAAADADGDGYVTPLEQQDWAASLPTRDDSLANPARFDPNLDRRASLEEFDQVVRQIAGVYREESGGELTVASLAAPDPQSRDRRAERRGLPPIERDRPRPGTQGGLGPTDVGSFGGWALGVHQKDCDGIRRRCRGSFGRYGFGLRRIDPYATGLTFRLRDETPRAALIDGQWYTVGPTD